MNRYLQNAIAACAIFALAAIGILALEIATLTHELHIQVAGLGGQLQEVTQHIDAVATDLDRTMQIAGGAVNEARRIERDNRQEIAAVNHQTLSTLQHVDDLIAGVNQSQERAATSLEKTADSLIPVMQQTQRDLADLEPAIQQVTPLLQRTTDIAVNLSNTTADVQHEVHSLVYPPPRKWYQKWITDPLKTAAKVIKLTHPI